MFYYTLLILLVNTCDLYAYEKLKREAVIPNQRTK